MPPLKPSYHEIEIFIKDHYGNISIVVNNEITLAALRRSLVEEKIIRNVKQPLAFLNKRLKDDNLTLKELGIEKNSDLVVFK